MAIFIFNNGGWIAVVWTFLVGMKYAWFEWITTRYVMKNYVGKYVLLAVDVPKNSEQTPKAAEQMFAHFHGISKQPIFPEKWGLPFTEFFSYGFVPPNMSVEIASLGGYVQFFVRCLIIQRDIIESAIYAQYPDAEITEVEDYVDFMPKPRELEHQKEWDCWSAQINFLRHSAYPIRTYPFFEHSMSQKLIDPMGALLEIMSRISPDEQIWIQWCLQQEDYAWRDKAQEIVHKLIGKKGKEKGSPWEVPRLVGQGVREALTASLIPPGSWETQKQKKDDPPSLMLHLSPGERDTVTQIEMKLSKIAFKVKGRFIYWGKVTPGPDGRKPFNKAKGVNGVVGALKQYAIADSNIFTFSKLTKTSDIVLLKEYRMRDRKRRNLYNYRIRSVWRGREAIYMNVEEMASIFHFPTIDVKAGQVQKSETKRGGAPVYLPTETPQIIQKMRSASVAAKASAPAALPTAEPLTPPPAVAPAQPQPTEPAPPQPQIPTNLPFIE
ncbi:MAG: hypothetical protein WC786_01670 [Patescibacteria group bacterium]